MDKQRYESLQSGLGLDLTGEEIEAGWHWCVEFDGALMNGIPHEGRFPICRCMRDMWNPRQLAMDEVQNQIIKLTIGETTMQIDRRMALTIVSALTDAIADGFDTEIEVSNEEPF